MFGLKGVSWTQLTLLSSWGLAVVAPLLLGTAWVALRRQREAAARLAA
jgi:hypothetical protein